MNLILIAGNLSEVLAERWIFQKMLLLEEYEIYKKKDLLNIF